MSSIGDQFNHLIHQGVQRLKHLPTQILQHLPSDQTQLGQPGRDQDVLRLRGAYLQQVTRPDGMETRPMTARETQVQRDREFFHANRGQLQDGQNWAIRDQHGNLHVRPHSSKAADMMMAVDSTTRIEAAPLHYMAGELQGGAETLKDTARLAKTVAQPFTTLQSLVESGAGKNLDHFRQNSAQITVDAVHQAGSDFLEAQNDPNRGGRATGKVGATILLAAAPLPIPKRLFRLRGPAAEAPSGALELSPTPNRIWRTHPNHTRPTGTLGGVPAGEMEKISQTCSETARSQIRQKESAELLADRGYRVRHLRDSTRAPGCRPDFEIEGKIFDNYAPRRASARNMWKDIRDDKILAGQTERIVINLDDSPATIEAVKEQFQNWPIDGLKEVIAIRKGMVEHIYP